MKNVAKMLRVLANDFESGSYNEWFGEVDLDAVEKLDTDFVEGQVADNLVNLMITQLEAES